jgi:hypothetical protein
MPDREYLKVWDIRYVYVGEKLGFIWEVFCLVHGEIDQARVHAADAIEHAEYLNKQENGPQARMREGHDILDRPYQRTEHWEHVPRPGFGAGWR